MLNPEARRRTIKGIRESRDEIAQRFKTALERLAKAKDENQVMAAKADLLSGILINLPMHEEQCYYYHESMLMDKEAHCDLCRYAVRFGDCGSNSNPWKDLMRAIEHAKTLVHIAYPESGWVPPLCPRCNTPMEVLEDGHYCVACTWREIIDQKSGEVVIRTS